MPVLASRGRAIVLALALPWLLTATAAAQAQGDKDLKAISAYTLTLPRFKQLMAAMANLGKAAQRDPKLGQALENSGNLSLDQMVARYDAIAPAKQSIADAGLTTRQFAVAQGAMLQAGMSYGIMKQYNLSADSVSKSTGVSKANLEFMRVNEAEIERMGKELQAQMPTEQPSDEAKAGSADQEEGDSTE